MNAATHSGKATVSLPTDTQILIAREFDAPAQLVYRAFTEPELVSRWWSGRRGEVTVCEIDLRVGGRWRYVMIANGGFEVAFHGDYRELIPDERVVSTQVYEAFPDAEAIVTTTMVERDGRTTMTTLVQHSCQEHRDGHVNSGMEGGMQESFDKLEEVARSLR
ncbi:MAG: SRPBCC family protein [Solirubrobacteraceae bacterium]